MANALRLRGNPRKLDEAKHLPPTNGTYRDTGFYTGQTSYLNIKILTFAKGEDMQFFQTTANLSKAFILQ